MGEAQREAVDAALLDAWLMREARKRGHSPPDIDPYELIERLRAALADRVGWTQPE